MKLVILSCSFVLFFEFSFNQIAQSGHFILEKMDKAVFIENNKQTLFEKSMKQNSFISCKKNRLLQQNKHFTILKATSQTWTAGVHGGGSGTEYFFKIIVNSKKELKFDFAWINNIKYEIFLAKESPFISEAPIKLDKGDTITLRVSAMKNNNTKSESPFVFDGEALISYKIKNKQKYQVVKKITTEESPNRP